MQAAKLTLFSLLPFAAGGLSLLLAAVSVLRKKPSLATWCFFTGMVALGLDSILTGLAVRETRLEETVSWLTAGFVVKSVIPVVWLCFSLTYSRTNYREFLSRWRIPLLVVGLLPLGLSLGFHDRLFEVASGGAPDTGWRLQFGAMARALNAFLLVSLVLILINLEQTFRSAVGTMRWRIKFVVLALIVIFGAQLYVRSQAILFSAPDATPWSVESAALLIGSAFLVLAYRRTGWAEIAVYPSSAVLRSSLTILIVGGYLFIVGVLAQVVRRFGGAQLLQLQAMVVLLGMAGLAVLLLSDRTRQWINSLVVRHFRKAQHDSVRIWTHTSQRLATVTDEAGLCSVSAKLISETFDVLSVTIWLLDNEKGQLVVGASTARPRSELGVGDPTATASNAVTTGLMARSTPFDLDAVREPWAEELRQLNSTTFAKGGNRLCVPLRAGEQTLGGLVLADRINGAPYTVEELDLLKCLGDQMTSVLLNLRLGTEVARAKELEAFRTVSAFFVHDLKNAAASLNLMLKNLPVHFDDPAFRQDALRGIGNTAGRIDEMIARLSALRQRPDFSPVKSDLNQLVSEALNRVNDLPNVELRRDLQPLPTILADPEQIQSVVTNLVQNARDALGPGGRIHVRTERAGGRVVLSIVDNGCGMSQAFLRHSLFRPFHTTKKKGLGIGLFQCRAIVQAHGGGMHVESEIGKGTTILASFPIPDEP
jgi:putative PEP-CTERM system histidine kinase